MKLLVSLLLLIAAFNPLLAQDKSDDVTVILREQTLNKLFSALGPVYGSDTYSVMFVKGTYQWTLLNPHIELKTGKAEFVADINVTTGILTEKTNVTGEVSITYASDSNKIVIQITKAICPLYTKLFGARVHIKDLDLAEYFKSPFVFDGPLSITTDMDFTMPDGSVRRTHAIPSHCDVQVQEDQIVVPCKLEFISVSIKPR